MIGTFRGLGFHYRPDTTDWNTINACVTEDEYDLASVEVVDRLVFDIGAHVGGVAVWCAARGAHVVAVEAVPENAKLIAASAEFNAVPVEVVEAALADRDGTIEFGWGGIQTETQSYHRFIGGTGNFDGERYQVKAVTFSRLCQIHGMPDIVKMDCEGGEWAALRSPDLGHVPLIVGEWHPVEGHTREDFLYALERTHDVTLIGPDCGPAGFRAVLR